jgi:predicted N-formylglutamate amidohydrolase
MSARWPDVPAGARTLADRSFLVTCEHGGNRVAPPYAPHFAGWQERLDSHRGYDAGALAAGRELARALAAPLVASTTSRLVVDLNRSIGHPRLYSEALRQAAPALRAAALARYYLPYRRRVERLIAAAIGHGRQVVHISSHSFTPVLDGEVRNADIGLLYDPGRPDEADLCRRWLAALKALSPQLKVRRNYPYTGKSDGFCAHLRRRYPAAAYAGIELEINQKHVFGEPAPWRALRRTLAASLLNALRD